MKRWVKILLAAAVTVVLAVVIDGVYCRNVLCVSRYNISSEKLDTSLKIVLIADQHNRQFGTNDSRLVEKIREQSPDIIAVDGDMVTTNEPNDDVMKSLLPQLAEIAPTYYCLGNHELLLKDKIDFKSDITAAGAVLLDNESVVFEKDGQQFLIGGLTEYPYYDYYAPDFDNPERYFWDDFCNSSDGCFSILLHHKPEYTEDMLSKSNVDLVLCGHTHGGLIRIPFIGGLYAPNQGFFPKYDKGEFDLNGTKMIITSGLGNSNFVPRLNNCAEICVINVN